TVSFVAKEPAAETSASPGIRPGAAAIIFVVPLVSPGTRSTMTPYWFGSQAGVAVVGTSATPGTEDASSSVPQGKGTAWSWVSTARTNRRVGLRSPGMSTGGVVLTMSLAAGPVPRVTLTGVPPGVKPERSAVTLASPAAPTTIGAV